jgi:hypothetical protein
LRTIKSPAMNYQYSLNAALEQQSKPARHAGNWPPFDAKCVCKVCGYALDTITTVHAQSHGYPDKKTMIDAGMVRFLNKQVKVGR